jgi:hypothetical protein
LVGVKLFGVLEGAVNDDNFDVTAFVGKLDSVLK